MVKKGETFRRAHEIAGKLISYAEKKGRALAELSFAEYSSCSPLFGQDVYSVTVESSLAARDIIGGTAPKRVAKAVAAAKKTLGQGD
jgi:argininosuccinate lyase